MLLYAEAAGQAQRDALRAVPTLAASHWATQAAATADALGIAGSYLPAQRNVPVDAVRTALREAAQRSPSEAPALAELTRAWYARFQEEFPDDSASAAGSGFRRIVPESRGRVGYLNATGMVRPGIGYPAGAIGHRPGLPFTGAEPLPDFHAPFASLLLAAVPAPNIGLVLEPTVQIDSAALQRWEAVGVMGPLSLSVGREAIGYGFGVRGGVVFSGTVPVERLQLQTVRSIRLPWVLRSVGGVSFNTFLTRLDDDRHPGDPFLWGAAVSVRPHPRLTLAIQRGALFGGDSVRAPVTAVNLARLFVGRHTRDFENQVVSAGVRYRVPVEQVIPLVVYGEWGAEDSAGAWHQVPGAVLGMWVPAIPSVPQVSVGVEYSSFAKFCCGNPAWYRHWGFLGGWAAGDQPLGHPLGGRGSELAVYSRATLLDSKLRTSLLLTTANRGPENLYAPQRSGRSAGAAVGVAWRASRTVDLELDASRLQGDEWAESSLRAGAAVRF